MFLNKLKNFIYICTIKFSYSLSLISSGFKVLDFYSLYAKWQNRVCRNYQETLLYFFPMENISQKLGCHRRVVSNISNSER